MIEVLGRYEILEEIGQGGFAVVYRARDTELKRVVALKELRQSLLRDTEWVKRFRREAQTIARLDHPRIVTIFDVYEAAARLFIVMRLVDGSSLADLLASQGTMPWLRCKEIIAALAEGLDYAHAQGLIHRDLKPANVLLDSKRGPLLSDFGLAKLVGEVSAELTGEGAVVGTPHYIAPEIWDGQASSPRSDIYALGCILYEMLTGKKAARGVSPPAVMMAHFKPIDLPETWPEGIPSGVDQVLRVALARQPEERFASAKEMVAAMDSLEVLHSRHIPRKSSPSSLMPGGTAARSVEDVGDEKPWPATALAKTKNLPVYPTPFVGRSKELADITTLLNQPACRLVTLRGPGGIGKTRLATAVAEQLQDSYPHGVYLASLQAIETVDFLISAIADALNFPLAGQEAPAAQLFNYLQNRHLLLLLDNFEQLLADNGEALLSDILAAAPEVTLLVTSREALNLQEEWLYTIEGLSLAQQSQTSDLAESEAVKLFGERAQRMRPDFSLATELSDVVEICRLVEGIPLAIELAAAWTKMLTCHAIAAEISQSLDILATSHRNVPDRQQSMRAIFDQTWQQLSQNQRDVFKRLSIFRGGFRRQAAEQVAGATLPLLSVLQDKSLLRWNPDGRYHLHELLRQYAAERLARSADALAQIRDLHCAFYAEYLHERNLDFLKRPQLEAITEIRAELENIRAAWHCAVEDMKITEIKKMARPLGIFCNLQSRYAEGLKAFEGVAFQLANQPETQQTGLALADVLMVQTHLLLRFGRLEDIEAKMSQSQAIYRRLKMEPGPGYMTDPTVMLSFVALVRGDYPAAVEYAQQARVNAERHKHAINREFAYFLLARAALAQGHYQAAQDFAREAYIIGQAAEDRWFMAYILNTLGDISFAQKAYPVAREHYQAAFTIRQEFNDPEGMAAALNHLAETALWQESYAEAQRLFQESLRLYLDINDKGGLATSNYGLGYTMLAQDDFNGARRHFYRALRLAADIWFLPAILTVLVGIGELLCRAGQPEKGLGLSVLVQHHAAANQETKDRAGHLLKRFKLQVRSERLSAATRQGQTANLETTIKSLLAELPTLVVGGPPQPGDQLPDPNQILVDPLTAREMDVLRLLAEGLSNQEIGDQLTIAEGTVKYYTRQIYGKLQVRNRTQAISLARELKLV